ncbi:MAG: PEP-CTERM sorting domain-containing protein [Akkermansia sp.]|nr:PEP-CTERM sorting domain-containing protein [Akkermansia sp.]
MKAEAVEAAAGAVILKSGAELNVYESSAIGSLTLGSGAKLSSTGGEADFSLGNIVLDTLVEHAEISGRIITLNGSVSTLQTGENSDAPVSILRFQGTLSLDGLTSIAPSAKIQIKENSDLSVQQDVCLNSAQFEVLNSYLDHNELNAKLTLAGYRGLDLAMVNGENGTLVVGVDDEEGGASSITSSISFASALQIATNSSAEFKSTTLTGDSFLYGSLETTELALNEGVTLSGTGKLSVTGTTTMADSAVISLADNLELSLGAVTGSGTLVLGNGTGDADTEATAASFTGMLDIKSDAQLTVGGETSLADNSSLYGTLETTDLVLNEGVTLSGTGKLSVTGTTTMADSAVISLADNLNLSLGAVTGSGKLVLGDGIGDADTEATAASFTGMLDIKSDAQLKVGGETLLAGKSTSYGCLTTDSLTLLEDALFDIYDAGKLSAPLILTLNSNAQLNFHSTNLADFLNSMEEKSITLESGSILYGQGDLVVNDDVRALFAQFEGCLSVSGTLKYVSDENDSAIVAAIVEAAIYSAAIAGTAAVIVEASEAIVVTAVTTESAGLASSLTLQSKKGVTIEKSKIRTKKKKGGDDDKDITIRGPEITVKNSELIAEGSVTLECITNDLTGKFILVDNSDIKAEKKTVSMTSGDITIQTDSEVSGPTVEIEANNLSITGGAKVTSGSSSKLTINDSTTVDAATLSLNGLSDGSSLGALEGSNNADIALQSDSSENHKVSADSISLNGSSLNLSDLTMEVKEGTTLESKSALSLKNATLKGDSLKVGDGSVLKGSNSSLSMNSVEVKRGGVLEGVSCSVGSGCLFINDGEITSALTINGGEVRGSGTFSNLILNSGKLVVGNSPGLQTYTGDLELYGGEVIFSVAGFAEPASAADCSWDDSVYSYIDMSGASFLFNANAGITLSVGGEVLKLFENAHSVTDTIELVLMQNVGNASTLNLELLADITQLVVTSESAGYSDSSFSIGSSLTDYYKSIDYKIDGNNVVLSVYLVPEPTTATLSLLALAGLAVRRRRR